MPVNGPGGVDVPDVMNPLPPTRLEELHMRVLDGEASPTEHAELLAMADAQPPLDAFCVRGGAIRAAFGVPCPLNVSTDVSANVSTDVSVDIADDVMAAIDAEHAWEPFGASLRDALSSVGALPIDVADDVMRALAEEAAFAPQAALLRTAFAPAPMHVPFDVSDAVMAAITGAAAQNRASNLISLPAPSAARTPARIPLWASLGAPLVGMLAAAAILFAVVPATPPTVPAPEVAVGIDDGIGGGIVGTESVAALRLGARNDAQVEDIRAGNDAVVQVMQFEEGGPTFILIDDQPMGVPL